MAEKTEDFGILDFDAPVSEMASDAGSIIQLDPARVQSLLTATGDVNPQFPVLRVEGGLSGQGNFWTDSVLRDVAEQINKDEPVGYLGHIKPDDDGYAFPEPQTIWLKASTRQEGGKEVLYVKGYNFPDAKIKGYLKTGITRAASWRGKASGPVISGVRQIMQFKLESFDWSRKGKNGMNANLVELATEMEGKEEDEVAELGKVTKTELQEANPNLVQLLKDEGAAEAQATISEMEPKVKAADEADETFTKLRELLKIDEKTDVVEAVATVMQSVEDVSKKTLTDKIGEILAGKVKGERARSSIARLVPITEMENLDDDALKVAVEKLFDEDDDIKAIVTEMEGTPAPLSHKGVDRQSGKAGGSGMVTESTAKL